jgi:hypothetical protein
MAGRVEALSLAVGTNNWLLPSWEGWTQYCIVVVVVVRVSIGYQDNIWWSQGLTFFFFNFFI